MDYFIDIHSHVLPNVDDGAQSIKEAEELFKVAYEDGIREIIATPHFHPYKGRKSPSEIREAVNQMNRMIENDLPGMIIHPGNEVLYGQNAVEMLHNKEMLTLNDSKYVLVEFSPRETAGYIQNAVKNLIFGGYKPILAHIERYSDVSVNYENIRFLVDSGAYVQVNAANVSNGRVKKLLKNKLVHFVGSDTHGIRKRSSHMKTAYSKISNKWGEDYADELFFHNPRHVIESKIII